MGARRLTERYEASCAPDPDGMHLHRPHGICVLYDRLIIVVRNRTLLAVLTQHDDFL